MKLQKALVFTLALLCLALVGVAGPIGAASTRIPAILGEEIQPIRGDFETSISGTIGIIDAGICFASAIDTGRINIEIAGDSIESGIGPDSGIQPRFDLRRIDRRI